MGGNMQVKNNTLNNFIVKYIPLFRLNNRQQLNGYKMKTGAMLDETLKSHTQYIFVLANQNDLNDYCVWH